MKTIRLFFSLILLSSILISCDKINSLFEDDNDDPNTIGGETNIPLNQVGNTFTTTVKIGDNYYNLNEQITVTKNEDGVARIHVVADVPNIPEIQTLIERIPADIINNQGKIDAEFSIKMTSEGIQDYFNKDGKAHTIVKYDANVGDTYKITKSDGNTITRTVTQKSTTDDFPYGFYLIKTITVEQDSRIPGVQKIIYKANHKFGLVHVEMVMEDGSKASSYIYTENY